MKERSTLVLAQGSYLSKISSVAIIFALSLSCLSFGAENTADSQSKPRIQILMAKDRGGFGDIAVNLTMAEKIAREYAAQYEVELLILKKGNENSTSTEQDKVAQLWPEYDSQLPTQILAKRGGLKVVTVSKQQAILTSGYTLASFSFSRSANAADTLELSLVAGAKTSMNYLELGDERTDLTHDFPGHSLSMRLPILPNLDNQRPTGAGQGGLYISVKKPSAPMSRSELMTHLMSFDHELLPNSKLAAVYSRAGLTTSKYITALAHFARQNPKENFVVLTLASPDLTKDNLPTNLKVLSLRTLPFEVFESAIAHADLPPLVGGDSSLSMAVDYEKPFFYEAFAWKFRSASMLIEEIEKHNPEFEKSIEMRDLLERSLQIDVSGSSVAPDLFLQVFNNDRYLSEFKNTISRIRSRNSLVRTVMNEIWISSASKDGRGSEQTKNFVRDVLRDVDPQNLFEFLRAQALNSGLTTEVRLQSIRAVLEPRTAGIQENLEMMKSLLANQKDRAYSRIVNFLAININAVHIQYYLMRAARDPRPEVRAGAINVLESIHGQDEAQYNLGRTQSQTLMKKFYPQCSKLFEN